MREALFFLSLTMLLSLYGLFHLRLGILIAAPLFLISFWVLIVRSKKTFLSFGVLLLISTVLLQSTRMFPLSKTLFMAVAVTTIVLILAYTSTSRDVDVAPTFMGFIAIMLFLRTCTHIAISDKFSWGALVFLTTAAYVDDWNMKRRLPELPDEESCVAK